jgi:hypothetical protein
MGGWLGPRAVLDAVVKRKIPSLRRDSNRTTPIVMHMHPSITLFMVIFLYIIPVEGCSCEYTEHAAWTTNKR